MREILNVCKIGVSVRCQISKTGQLSGLRLPGGCAPSTLNPRQGLGGSAPGPCWGLALIPLTCPLLLKILDPPLSHEPAMHYCIQLITYRIRSRICVAWWCNG